MISFLRKRIPDYIKELAKDFFGLNFIRNHYRTRYKKNVLISYLNKPFFSKHRYYSHTNLNEAVAIAETFKSLGYNVDLINHTRSKKYNVSKYDIVFGIGEAVEYALLQRSPSKKNPFVIWHATGASPFFSNPVTIERLQFIYKTHNELLIESTRFIEKLYPLSYIFSDLIILYGNDFTKDTYAPYTHSPIEKITPTTHINSDESMKVKTSKIDYVWFGSKGAIHKGLDLVLDFFLKNPHLNLHVCGDLTKEDRFYEIYKDKISMSSNIHVYGFMDIMSEESKRLMKLGVFTILPSCSEGIATSVLTTMANGGMIPIVTRNTGIDIHDYGILIEELSPEGIEKSIHFSQTLSLEQINSRTEKIVSYCHDNYTIENFKKNLRKILTMYIEKSHIDNVELKYESLKK